VRDVLSCSRRVDGEGVSQRMGVTVWECGRGVSVRAGLAHRILVMGWPAYTGKSQAGVFQAHQSRRVPAIWARRIT